MRKKTFGFLFLIMVVALSLLAFVGCGSLKLSNPENVNYDGLTITWNAVENADKYTVQIDGGNEYTVTSTKYPYTADNSDFTVTITAVSNSSKIVSSGATTMEFKALGKISDARFDEDGKISWDVVNNATGYKLRVDGDDSTIYTTTSANYSQLPSGQHSVQVKAYVESSSSYYSVWSDSKSYNILSAVNKDEITYSDGRISWHGISGARYYEVAVNGNVLSSDCTTTSIEYDSDNANFDVTVRAIGNGSTTFNGSVSEEKKFVYLDTVTNIYVEDGILKWDEVSSASGYKLKINGTYKETLTECSYSKLSANTNNEIQIMPISEDNTYFSDWSVVKSVLILKTPILQWNSDYELDGEANSNAYWDGISNAAGYTIRLTDPSGTPVIKTYGETQRFFQEAYLEVGTYTVELKANASTTDSNVYDSTYSTPIKVTRLASPKAADKNYIVSSATDITEGFTVTFTNVSGAKQYKIYKDDSLLQTGTTNQFAVTNVVDSSVIEEQTYNYAIRSIGATSTVNGQINAVISSLSSEALTFSITVLAAPTDPTMSGYIYSYGSINKSSGYVIDIGGQSYSSGDTTYDLSILEAGNYTVKVCAKGNGSTVLPSNYSTPIQVYRLSAPTNVRITTTENSEGLLTFDSVDNAQGYLIVFNNDGNALPAEYMMNMNQYITEQGTTVYMQSKANCYDSNNSSLYYMTSNPGTTTNFIKLAAPTFGQGSARFSGTQLIWNQPSNINTSVYTPTYQVYNASGDLYDGDKNGTTLDISQLEGGKSYTFYVKAIGNTTNYINSNKSEPVTIWKLATPTIKLENGKYVWNSVLNGVSYALYIDGVLMYTSTETYSTYSYKPTFTDLKTYKVELYAIGDGGYNSINSDAYKINQTTKQLTTPDFTYGYSAESYSATGTINFTITDKPDYAAGYSYTLATGSSSGGVAYTSTEDTYSFTPSSVGTYTLRVYALGGNFDGDGVYYLDSQSVGGNSKYQITLLGSPSKDSININMSGALSWATVANAVKYEIEIIKDGVSETVYSTASTIAISKDDVSNLVVRIRAVGNGTTIITSDWVEIERNY